MLTAQQQAETNQLRLALASLSGPTPPELLVLADDPANAQALRSLVAAHKAVAALPAYRAMKADVRVEKHCLRCHSRYTDKHNSQTACTVPHVFGPDRRFGASSEGYYRVYEYDARCCRDVILEEEGSDDEYWANIDEIYPCYEGSHTSDPTEMTSDSAFNDMSIVRCKLGADGKCTVKERHWDEAAPFFGQ